MDFQVEEPDAGLASMIESGPQFVCIHGDENCAFRTGGPCTAVDCTCETLGSCESCTPKVHRGILRRIG